MLGIERAISKLKIEAFSDNTCEHRIDKISAMYNPHTIDLDYTAEYESANFLDSKNQLTAFKRIGTGKLTLDLIFDARLPGNTKSIDDQLRHLRSLCMDISGGIHEPRYLRVRWGAMNWHGHGYYAGRASSLKVKYTLFGPNALPQRATATLEIEADESVLVKQASDNLKAPKKGVITSLEHTPLPLLLGTTAGALLTGNTDYLKTALTNNLDNVTSILPGQQLVVGS